MQHETSRNEWPVGKIMEKTPDEDGPVRSVRIKLGVKGCEKERNNSQSSIIIRPIQKVVPLLEEADLN